MKTNIIKIIILLLSVIFICYLSLSYLISKRQPLTVPAEKSPVTTVLSGKPVEVISKAKEETPPTTQVTASKESNLEKAIDYLMELTREESD